MMHTPYAIGVSFLTFLGVSVINIADTAIAPATGIQVHSLSFTNDPAPMIVQDRTVTADRKLIARWEATITAGGVEACNGAGVWDYPAGHAAPKLDIDEWTGDAGCWHRLPANVTLQACAKYAWGDGESTEACSLAFRKVE